MYLHLGNGQTVKMSEVVGIFDIEKASTSRDTREYLARAGKNRCVTPVTDDLPKSFVVCLDSDLTERVYLCGVSAQTLRERAEGG